MPVQWSWKTVTGPALKSQALSQLQTPISYLTHDPSWITDANWRRKTLFWIQINILCMDLAIIEIDCLLSAESLLVVDCVTWRCEAPTKPGYGIRQRLLPQSDGLVENCADELVWDELVQKHFPQWVGRGNLVWGCGGLWVVNGWLWLFFAIWTIHSAQDLISSS